MGCCSRARPAPTPAAGSGSHTKFQIYLNESLLGSAPDLVKALPLGSNAPNHHVSLVEPGDHPEFFRFPAPEGRSRESTIRLDRRGALLARGEPGRARQARAGHARLDEPPPRRRPLHPHERLRLDVLHGRGCPVLRARGRGSTPDAVLLGLSDGTEETVGPEPRRESGRTTPLRAREGRVRPRRPSRRSSRGSRRPQLAPVLVESGGRRGGRSAEEWCGSAREGIASRPRNAPPDRRQASPARSRGAPRPPPRSRLRARDHEGDPRGEAARGRHPRRAVHGGHGAGDREVARAEPHRPRGGRVLDDRRARGGKRGIFVANCPGRTQAPWPSSSWR